MYTSEAEKELLERIVAFEADEQRDWTYDEVRALPSSLLRLVVDGRIRITGEKRRRKTYRLATGGN